jgi:2'-5' RNA ligase
MRIFLAVDLSPSAVNTIESLQHEVFATAGWNQRDVKAVEKQNFHFTLLFLGEKSDSEVESVKAKISDLKFEPFTIRLTGLGAFPKPNYARVAWVGTDVAGGQKMEQFAADIVSRVSGIGPGFQQDKPFSPHLTIFRARAGGHFRLDNEIIACYSGKEFCTDIIDKLHIKQSDLTPSGPIYSNIYTVAATTVGGH